MSPHEIAKLCGLTAPAYYDLEECDHEIEETGNLRELHTLCKELKIQIADLFGDTPIPVAQLVSPDELAVKIKSHLAEKRLTISVFETQAGFEVGPFLDDSSVFWEWGIECLRSVCQEIGFDWLKALPR